MHQQLHFSSLKMTQSGLEVKFSLLDVAMSLGEEPRVLSPHGAGLKLAAVDDRVFSLILQGKLLLLTVPWCLH